MINNVKSKSIKLPFKYSKYLKDQTNVQEFFLLYRYIYNSKDPIFEFNFNLKFKFKLY